MRRLTARSNSFELVNFALTRPNPSAHVCLACRYRLLQDGSNHIAPLRPTRRSYANERPVIFEQVRKENKKNSADTEPQPKLPESNEDPEAKPDASKDPEIVTIGGESATAEEDVSEEENPAEFAERMKLEEEDMYQRAVDQALKHRDYFPAENWHGLERIGGETEKDEGEMYYPFAPLEKLESPEEITLAVHQALVELFAARSTNTVPRKMSEDEIVEAQKLPQDIRRIKLEPSSDGLGATLQFPDGPIQERVTRLSSRIVPDELLVEDDPLENIEASEIEEDQTALPLNEDEAIPKGNNVPGDKTELKRDVENIGQAWLNISLHDPEIKLELTRRITRLTGQHIPDNVLSKASNAGAILDELIRPPPPKKLYEALTGEDAPLPTLPNVKIMRRKVRMEDKERSLGRWKVIEEELRRRRLPVHVKSARLRA